MHHRPAEFIWQIQSSYMCVSSSHVACILSSPTSQHSIIVQHNSHLLTCRVFFFFSAPHFPPHWMMSKRIRAMPTMNLHNADPTYYPNYFCTLSFILVKPHWSCVSKGQLPWHCGFLMLFSPFEMHFLHISPHSHLSVPNPICLSLSSSKIISFLMLFITTLSLN